DGTGRSVTISGNNAVRLFNVTAGAVLLLQHLKLADGYARGADGVAAGAAGGSGDGGAIYNRGGRISAVDCTFFRNKAVGGTGARGTNSPPISPGSGGPAHGGAIFNSDGEVTATDCVFTENRALGGTGGTGGLSGGV